VYVIRVKPKDVGMVELKPALPRAVGAHVKGKAVFPVKHNHAELAALKHAKVITSGVPAQETARLKIKAAETAALSQEPANQMVIGQDGRLAPIKARAVPVKKKHKIAETAELKLGLAAVHANGVLTALAQETARLKIKLAGTAERKAELASQMVT